MRHDHPAIAALHAQAAAWNRGDLEGYLAWEAHRKTFHPQAQQASPPRQGFAGTPIARRTRHAARAITQVRACTCIRLAARACACPVRHA